MAYLRGRPPGRWPRPPRVRWRTRIRRLARRLIKERDFTAAPELVAPAVSWAARRRGPDISDGICAYIVGGLGNQLFILAAAWEQAHRLNCPLYVDYSWYQHEDHTRAPEIDAIDHPGIDVTSRSPWEGKILSEGPAGLVPVRSAGRWLHVFTEQSFGYDPAINTCVPGTTIAGYCQSPMYFRAIESTLIDRLLSAELQAPELEYVSEVSDDRRTTVHIRRGDYLYAHYQDLLGLAQNGYFIRAADLYERLNGASRYRVYSDSPETIGEMVTAFSDIEISNPRAPMSSLAVMRAMASTDGFIMSNSTFSWWAAWLMSSTNPKATVIAPRPWFTRGEAASDLLLPDWITLDRRD